MSIRFLADADLHAAIVRGVRRYEPSIDFKSAKDAALQGLPDPEVLELEQVRGEFSYRTTRAQCQSISPRDRIWG